MNSGQNSKNGKELVTGNAPDHELRVYSDISQLIASPENMTPLLRVNRTNPQKDFEIYLKLERYNPFGSIKDRIALAMLSEMVLDGKTIVEPSSGNTGIALAGLANALGVPVEIVVSENTPEEKKVMLRLLGATVTEVDDSICPRFPNEGARGLVSAMVRSPRTRDKYVSPNQYENELNVLAHYRTTGPEIWRQTKGKITHFFAGMGTGGTITGIGKFLKEQNPAIKIIAIEPSAVETKLSGLRRITALPEEYYPKILDRSVIDDVVSVGDDDACRTAVELARLDGILVGPSTGAVLYAALKYGKSNSGLAVGIAADDAFKYATFYRDYLEKASKGEKEQLKIETKLV